MSDVSRLPAGKPGEPYERLLMGAAGGGIWIVSPRKEEEAPQSVRNPGPVPQCSEDE